MHGAGLGAAAPSHHRRRCTHSRKAAPAELEDARLRLLGRSPSGAVFAWILGRALPLCGIRVTVEEGPSQCSSALPSSAVGDASAEEVARPQENEWARLLVEDNVRATHRGMGSDIRLTIGGALRPDSWLRRPTDPALWRVALHRGSLSASGAFVPGLATHAGGCSSSSRQAGSAGSAELDQQAQSELEY